MYPVTHNFDNCTLTEVLFSMSDGIGLYTRLLVPKGGSKCPIVFIRTPYAPASGSDPKLDSDLEAPFVEAGYAVVLQHCRGTGNSEGICIPYHERSDGLDTLALIRKQPFYNGEIFLYGMSYLATVHFCYLDPCPPDIKGAALSIQTDRMFFRNYRNGCCYDFCNLNWWLGMMKRQYPDGRANAKENISRPYKTLMQNIVGKDVPGYTACLLNDTYNAFWQDDPRTNVIENWKIPVLFTEGWYDFYIEGMFSIWDRLPEAAKGKSAFVVGPWGHATKTAKGCPYSLPEGDIPSDFPVQWFNSIRQNTAYPYAETGKLNFYSIGGGSWRIAQYPQRLAEDKRLYFREDHTLAPNPCCQDTRVSYLYDPEKTPGCFRHHGIFKAHEAGTVPGVISFFSEPAAETQSFLGPIHWHMGVSSDCEDTAFFIRVYLVEDGEAYNLTDTITSLSHWKPDYRSGEVLTLDIDTPPIAFTLKKGSRIRVDIASHSDIYVPNANVKGHWAEVTETRMSNNTLHLKEAYISISFEMQ